MLPRKNTLADAPPQLSAIPVVDILPGEETHPMMRLMPGKAIVIHLDRPVKKVLIDNKKRLGVYLSDPQTLKVLARQEKGIVHFSTLDGDGQVVMARYVVISDSGPGYFQAKMVCSKEVTDASCSVSRLYFCTNECFETKIIDAGGKQMTLGEASSAFVPAP
jgi:hypothetical protein